MAEPDPLLDDDLNEADRRTVDAIENPLPQSDNGPEPSDLDEIAPEAPVAPPSSVPLDDNLNEVKPPEPLPGAPETPPGMAPVPGSAEDIKARELTAEGLSKKQADLDVQTATTNAATARQIADAAREADEDARLERADYLQRRQEAEKDLQEKTKRLEGMRIVDPRTGHSLKSTLAVAFGNLGAAFRSAGGGDSKNHVIDQLQQQWHNDVEIQKANIAAARDNVIQARTNLRDADEGRRLMTRDADARLLARYNVALKQGEASLRNQGMTQAQIDGDKRIMSLRAGAAQALAQARKDDDAHALNQARIESLKAKAARDAKKAKGGGAGGGGGGGLRAFVAAANELGPGDPITPDVAALGRAAGLKPNQIAAEVDRYRGSGAKSAKAGAGGVGSVRQNAVLGNLAEAEKAAKEIKPGTVSMSSLQRLQTNTERHTAAQHAAASPLGAVGNAIGRAVGFTPRGEYDGIPDDEQKQITAQKQVITHLTEMQQGKNLETLEQYEKRYAPYYPGLSEAEVRRREEALPMLVAEQRAIQDPQGTGTKRQAAGEARAATGEGSIDAERMRKAKAALASPNAPAAVKAEAAKYLKRAIKSGEKAAAGGGTPIEDIVL